MTEYPLKSPAKFPLGYIYGCVPYVDNTGSLYITPGVATDDTNSANIILENLSPISIFLSGVGGLDIGSLQTGTTYSVFLISDGSGRLNPGVIISASPNYPVLPVVQGVPYSLKRLIGYASTPSSFDSGISFRQTFPQGNGAFRKVFYNQIDGDCQVFGGSAPTSRTFVNLTSGCPTAPNNQNSYVTGIFSATGANSPTVGDVLLFGSIYENLGVSLVSIQTVVADTMMTSPYFEVPVSLVNGLPSIYHECQISSGGYYYTLNLMGYSFSL